MLSDTVKLAQETLARLTPEEREALKLYFQVVQEPTRKAEDEARRKVTASGAERMHKLTHWTKVS